MSGKCLGPLGVARADLVQPQKTQTNLMTLLMLPRSRHLLGGYADQKRPLALFLNVDLEMGPHTPRSFVGFTPQLGILAGSLQLLLVSRRPRRR
jgi:hypothetical protein